MCPGVGAAGGAVETCFVRVLRCRRATARVRRVGKGVGGVALELISEASQDKTRAKKTNLSKCKRRKKRKKQDEEERHDCTR